MTRHIGYNPGPWSPGWLDVRQALQPGPVPAPSAPIRNRRARRAAAAEARRRAG